MTVTVRAEADIEIPDDKIEPLFRAVNKRFGNGPDEPVHENDLLVQAIMEGILDPADFVEGIATDWQVVDGNFYTLREYTEE